MKTSSKKPGKTREEWLDLLESAVIDGEGVLNLPGATRRRKLKLHKVHTLTLAQVILEWIENKGFAKINHK